MAEDRHFTTGVLLEIGSPPYKSNETVNLPRTEITKRSFIGRVH